jgi:XTP/dITP diphosphohydrolase
LLTAKQTPQHAGRALVLATTNAGKIREITALLRGLDWTIVSQREVGVAVGVEEDGETYEANALKKAVPLAIRLRVPVLADDSGLEVDALSGSPGVISARYAGVGASDADNRRLLLERLRSVPRDRRTARFRCVIAVASPSGAARLFEGSVEGRIRDAETGIGGFGYDPVFELPERGVTFAELPEADKNLLSHRARALAAVRDMLTTDAAWLG